MRRRKAETLVEFLMASVIFVEVMAGVMTFIANQTQTLVNIRDRDTMMFHVQRYLNGQTAADDVRTKDGVDISRNGNILTVSKGKSTMEINLKP